MTRNATLILITIILGTYVLQAQQQFQIGPTNTKTTYPENKKVFPCKWKNKKNRPKIVEIDLLEIPRTNRILKRALNKYPEDVLTKNLKRIDVFKSMMFFGLEYGGTYNKKTVYLANNGIDKGYSDSYIEGTFHHEFSSILLKRHYRFFDQEAWHSSNPGNFSYGKGGKDALRTAGSSMQMDTTLFEIGFLTPYAMASEEEDFNTYAHFLFLSDPIFWEAFNDMPAIRQKTMIMINFFSKLDPVFTLEHFQDL